MTTRVSGTPAAVINTPYVQKMGLELPWYLQAMKAHPMTKKYVVPLIHWAGMQMMQKAAETPTWKTVWSAGQSVGLINEILSCEDIMKKLVSEYEAACKALPLLT